MFNVNGWELVFIAVLFILLFGPERLPEIASQVGKTLRELRQLTEGATAELTKELELAARELREPPPGAATDKDARAAAPKASPPPTPQPAALGPEAETGAEEDAGAPSIFGPADESEDQG